MRSSLIGSGVIIVLIGLGWGAAFIYFDRAVLVGLHACLVAFGMTVACLAYRRRLDAAALLAGMFLPLFITACCLFDNVPNGVHRATHVHFLAVALGGYFVFRRGSIYMKYVMPATCLVAFAVFSHTSIGFHDPAWVIPASAAEIGVWTNTLTAIAELVFIVVIMHADLSVRRMMDIEMRKAIANGHFMLHYQPQIDEAGNVVGAEALIRWRHAKMGEIPPVKFIPLAEETGLIVPIGNWIMRAACAQLAQWDARPETRRLSMAVNISASQFRQPDFVQNMYDIVRVSGVNPSKLKLELTESMFVDDVGATVAKMSALKNMGLAWSLDDFGTGYSSLSVLNSFPLSQIKIDKSFVQGMLNNAANMAVTEAIIELAEKLNLQVVAEGVETVEQLNRLRQAGCRIYQGYLFSPPLGIDAFHEFLSSEASRAEPCAGYLRQ
ncbi:EAL domain-containing protein [Luteibacter sp. PPL201]|uniref:EAL domain-containing protein n=1 Tax=Luteibacter sahnii TaxID=3021977 RepID=A0ABT6BD83_9GAMM|nr:EAL domain-containing protein [Luteibacter sp. PPL193]MDY1549372.1 EAL domain-containing protein [Luteibacter sp. PPL193]